MAGIALQPLLLRQSFMLAFVLGAAAYLWPNAWVLLGILIAIDSRLHTIVRVSIVAGIAVAGCLYGGCRAVPPPPVWDNDTAKYEVSGRVEEVRGVVGGRLKITLDEVRRGSVLLKGKLEWTWDDSTYRPVKGESIRAIMRVRPSSGFRNSGRDSAYLERRGIYWRGTSRGELAYPRDVSGADAAALLREKWRCKLVKTLSALYPSPSFVNAEAARRPYNMSPSPPYGGWGMLPALLFGDRSYIGIDQMELLTDAGLAHSIALSGQHLATAGLFAYIFLYIFGRPMLPLWLLVRRDKVMINLAVIFAIGYLWLGSAPPSLWRAFLMMLAVAVFFLLHRPSAFPDGLIAALLCMVIADPSCLADVGVQLSFASVAGIALLAPTLRDVWSDIHHEEVILGTRPFSWKCKCFILSLFLCSLAVQVTTFPVILHTFGRVSPMFLINLIWLPVLGFWVLPTAFIGLGCLVFGAEWLASWVLTISVWPCRLLFDGLDLLKDADWLDSIWMMRPHWLSMIGWFLLVLAVALKLHRPFFSRKIVGIAFLGILFLFAGLALWLMHGCSDAVTLRVLDVGQGQSVLFELPRNRRLLVDCGSGFSDRFDIGRDVVSCVLAYNSPLRIDWVAVTHADTDHYSGLLFIARVFDIGAVIIPKGIRHSEHWDRFMKIVDEKHIPVIEAVAGMRIDLGNGIDFEILAPFDDARFKNAVHRTNDGLIVRLVRDGRGLVMLPGDAGRSLQRQVSKFFNCTSDILIAPHHGSGRNVSVPFISKVSPREVLISAGRGNHYGFPSKKFLDTLEKKRIPFRVTAEDGELQVIW